MMPYHWWQAYKALRGWLPSVHEARRQQERVLKRPPLPRVVVCPVERSDFAIYGDDLPKIAAILSEITA